MFGGMSWRQANRARSSSVHFFDQALQPSWVEVMSWLSHTLKRAPCKGSPVSRAPSIGVSQGLPCWPMRPAQPLPSCLTPHWTPCDALVDDIEVRSWRWPCWLMKSAEGRSTCSCRHHERRRRPRKVNLSYRSNVIGSLIPRWPHWTSWGRVVWGFRWFRLW